MLFRFSTYSHRFYIFRLRIFQRKSILNSVLFLILHLNLFLSRGGAVSLLGLIFSSTFVVPFVSLPVSDHLLAVLVSAANVLYPLSSLDLALLVSVVNVLSLLSYLDLPWLVYVALVPLPASLLTPAFFVSVAFVPLPVYSLVFVFLVSVVHTHLALFCPSHFPS